MEEYDVVMDKIKRNFIDNHVSFVYENICKEKMWDLNVKGKLGFTFNKLGRWWNNTTEIDIVGYDSNGIDIIFGECKYTNNQMDVDVLYNLEKKAKEVEWKKDNRREKFILFSINGYSKRLVEIAESRDDIILG